MVACRAFKEAVGRDWLYAHRNRFVVAYYDGMWLVFRVEQKYSVTVVLRCKHEEVANEQADRLNDMYEEGQIV